MHSFDIVVEEGQHFKESETLTPGESITVFDTEFGKGNGHISNMQIEPNN